MPVFRHILLQKSLEPGAVDQTAYQQPCHEQGVDPLSGLIHGLVVLCLAQFFARGMDLERDLDGLM